MQTFKKLPTTMPKAKIVRYVRMYMDIGMAGLLFFHGYVLLLFTCSFFGFVDLVGLVDFVDFVVIILHSGCYRFSDLAVIKVVFGVVIQAAISCEFLSFAFYSIQICFAAGFHGECRRIRACSSCDVPSSFLLKFKNLYGWSYIVNRSKAGFKAIKRSADTLARFNGFNVFGMEKGHFACHLKTMSSVVMQNDLS